MLLCEYLCGRMIENPALEGEAGPRCVVFGSNGMCCPGAIKRERLSGDVVGFGEVVFSGMIWSLTTAIATLSNHNLHRHQV